MVAEAQRAEALGPAERIIQALTTYVDHAVHNRPGLVTVDGRHTVGVRWEPATWRQENGTKVVYTIQKVGKKQRRTRVGVGVPGTDEVRDDRNRLVGRFRPSGLFPEVVAYIYTQIAEIWAMDNEFAARWASWAFFNESSRDLKVILAAFMLVQSRFGEPVQDGDETFADADYRAVGEAMCLIRSKRAGRTFNPKLLLRIGEILEIPHIIEANRALGFGKTGRRAITGRYYKVVEKWLRYIEANPKLLDGLVNKEGFRSKIMALCRKVGFKPQTDRFFEILRWRQKQSKEGHRTVGLDEHGKNKCAVEVDSWEGLSEKQICEKIEKERPGWKVISGKLPKSVGVTRAVVAVAIESECLSDADLIILTPTIEELGLLEVPAISRRWKQAVDTAEDQRAKNIAKNVRTQKAKEGLQEASDKAAAKAVEEVTRDMRVYVFVDKSSSMHVALCEAKEYLKDFVGAFPLERLHVAVFNTVGQEVKIPRATSAGVEQAFRGHNPGGGTSYARGVDCLLRKHKPKPEEDALFVFVGDQEDYNDKALADICQAHGVIPVAFGMLHVSSRLQWPNPVVELAAHRLQIPFFNIDRGIFKDPYAVPRTLRNLIAATPVGKKPAGVQQRRFNLVETILDTPLLQKPAWA